MQKNFAGETITVQNIPTHLIMTAPQVRTRFNEATIRELAADIKERGVLQPLVVRPKNGRYELMIGERRFRACKIIGAATVPAIVADVNDETKDAAQLIENIQREDLNAKDLANAVKGLWMKHKTVAKVAKVCNKSKSWVSKKLAIAMNVGPLTAQLLDANAKDSELVYTFATLEKADDQRARALLPRLLDGEATRKDVQAALAEVLSGKKAEEPAEDDDTTGDLFEDAEPPAPTDKTPEELAIFALRQILKIPTGKSPLEKWEIARDVATAAIEAYDKKAPITRMH